MRIHVLSDLDKLVPLGIKVYELFFGEVMMLT